MEPAATARGLKCHSPGAQGSCRAPGLSSRSNLVPGRRGFDLEFVLRPMWCGECGLGGDLDLPCAKGWGPGGAKLGFGGRVSAAAGAHGSYEI